MGPLNFLCCYPLCALDIQTFITHFFYHRQLLFIVTSTVDLRLIFCRCWIVSLGSFFVCLFFRSIAVKVFNNYRYHFLNG